jgi:hypothetical protein
MHEEMIAILSRDAKQRESKDARSPSSQDLL